MQKLLNKIRADLNKLHIDSLFITGQENVIYLTGISGINLNEREVFLLITQKNAYLFAFATTFLMYKSVMNFKSYELTVDFKLNQILVEVIKKENLKNIAIESDNISFKEFESLKNKLNIPLISQSGIIEKIRLQKTESEIKNISKAANLTDEAFKYILTQITEGISEKELALKIEFFIRKNSENISFSPIVAFNQNAAIPHYLPSAKIKLQNESLVLLDLGAKYNSYCADLTRVVFYGKPKTEFVKIYNLVKQAQEKAIASLKVGVKAETVDQIARKEISLFGFPVYNHGLGHGVGLAIHESPRLRPNIKDVLKENMVFTIEPGIYIENFAGVRIEDLIVLRIDGPELLSQASKEIIVL